MTVATSDPFAVEQDTDDPFASGDTLAGGGGGSFAPSPSGPEGFHRALVAMIPRKLETASPVPAQFAKTPGETRERFTVDLYVLASADGGDLRFWYNAKQEGTDERVPTEHTVPASDLPYHVPNYWIVQGAIVGQLRRAADSTKPIVMGRVRRGPVADDRGKKTFDQVEAEWDAFIARGQRGTKPRFSWQIEASVPGSEDYAAALAWWKSAGVQLGPIEKV